MQSSSTLADAGPSVIDVTVAGSWLRALSFMARKPCCASMWAFAMVAPGRLERVEAAVPEWCRAACWSSCTRVGSAARTCRRSSASATRSWTSTDPGFPLHEVVGEVVDGELPVGTRVVGWAEGHLGLAEYFLARVDNVLEIDDELNATDATVIQPLCTVLHALDRLGDVAGRHVAVLGQGPIGILFSRALQAAERGSPAWIALTGATSTSGSMGRLGRRRRLGGLVGDDGPEIVIEAIGHQAGTLEAAIEAVAPSGVVLAFGVPDEAHYASRSRGSSARTRR